MNRHIIFISDLHLSANRHNTTKLLEKFTDELTDNNDAVYILGDIFQYWAGDDDKSQFNRHIKDIFKKIAAKTNLYLMVGNRDFLLRETFATECNATLLEDPITVDLYGKKTVLTHGDILCTKDFKYATFRKIIRFPFLLKMFLKLPLRFRLWLASKVQKFSSRIKSVKHCKAPISSPNSSSLGLPSNYNNRLHKNGSPHPQQDTIEKLLITHNSDLIIHGHMHQIEIDEFQLNNKTAKRICLDEWSDEVKILIYYNNHNFEFKKISTKN